MRTSLERGQKVKGEEGVEELDHLEEARARKRLGQQVGEHVGAREMLDVHGELENHVTTLFIIRIDNFLYENFALGLSNLIFR